MTPRSPWPHRRDAPRLCIRLFFASAPSPTPRPPLALLLSALYLRNYPKDFLPFLATFPPSVLAASPSPPFSRFLPLDRPLFLFSAPLSVVLFFFSLARLLSYLSSLLLERLTFGGEDECDRRGLYTAATIPPASSRLMCIPLGNRRFPARFSVPLVLFFRASPSPTFFPIV